MTLDQFRATKVEMTKTAFEKAYGIPVENCDTKKVLVYCDGLFISQVGRNRYNVTEYNLLIERDEYQTIDLALLEEKLYKWSDGECLDMPELERVKYGLERKWFNEGEITDIQECTDMMGFKSYMIYLKRTNMQGHLVRIDEVTHDYHLELCCDAKSLVGWR